MEPSFPDSPTPPTTATVVRDPSDARPQVVRRSSKVPIILLGMLCAMLAVALFFSLCMNLFSSARFLQSDTNLVETQHSGDAYASDKIAIISVSGVMIQGNGFTKRQIDRVREDEDVKAVVLRIDSPGGAVTAADYLFHHLKLLRDEREIPIVVSMGSMAASGGYYVAMAASHDERVIFCEPTGITGSIGVIIPRYDISGLLDEYGVKSDSIASHPRKELGSWTKPMTAEERTLLKDQVDLLFNRFKDIVREGRPYFAKHKDALDKVATGEVFTGNQAKELKLIDEVGFIEDAIERAAELGNLSEDNYRVVEYKRPATLADALTGSVEAPQNPLNAEQILDMSTPRAYYLYSWLPGFVPQ